MKSLLALAVSLAFSPVVALAAEVKSAAPAHSLDQFKLGAHITGPAATLEDAKGKEVLIEAWGVHCGPCLASLPHIEQLAKRNRNKMVVFGAHSQNAGDEEVKQVVKKNNLSFTITKGVSGPVNFNGIPHAFVFDASGALVFHGHPASREFDAAVQKATRGVAAAPAASRASGLDALKALQAK